MLKRLIVAAMPLCLAACASMSGPISSGVSSAGSVAAHVADAVWAPKPTPLAATAIDEKALTLSAKAVDTLALSASALVKAGVVTKGSPTALRLSHALDDARNGVNAAADARDALNAASYAAALTKAEAALATIRTIIGG